MMEPDKEVSNVSPNPWEFLKEFTEARIALGRAGQALPTAEWLTFSMAHAQAKDAVNYEFDIDLIKNQLKDLNQELLEVKTQAKDKVAYLKRPDLGRKLDHTDRLTLLASQAKGRQLSIIIADGLSAKAIEVNAIPFLQIFLPLLKHNDLSFGPITLASHARVALADEIGAALGAQLSVILIGERPGLSSPDSMGIYMTYQPQANNTDEKRNCISNIRPKGMPALVAAHKLLYLIQRSLQKGISGVGLKDDFDGRLIG